MELGTVASNWWFGVDSRSSAWLLGGWYVEVSFLVVVDMHELPARPMDDAVWVVTRPACDGRRKQTGRGRCGGRVDRSRGYREHGRPITGYPGNLLIDRSEAIPPLGQGSSSEKTRILSAWSVLCYRLNGQ
ncbi:unnamed protein product [Urochloa humidicola]